MDLIEAAKKSFRDELETAAIYAKLSSFVKDEALSKKLMELARMEAGHARFWAEFLMRRGVSVRDAIPSRSIISVKASLLRFLGLGLTLRLLETGERDAIEMYSRLLSSGHLGSDEAERLRKILNDELLHESEFEDAESRFKDFMNHVRDAVLGMNDGLVEILSVSAGLAGAYGNPLYVALGGVIVGVSGALSMGVGTYVSVKAQRDVKRGTLERVKLAAKYAGRELMLRVRNYFMGKGFSERVAEPASEEAGKNPELLSRLVSEEEYGLREESLDDPKKAGLYTGIFYILGAFVPLLPYFLGLNVIYDLALSFILAGVMLSISGALIAISAGLKIRGKVVELVLSGLGSATITYLIGLAASALLGIEVG
jgi:VIT1/CCC1 family predicted Fe2+/Mn2+ transporter